MPADEDDVTAPGRPSKMKNKERNNNPLHGPQAEIKGMETPRAPIGALRPNPWNYNTQSESVFNKLVASIRRHGFTKPVTVREVDGRPGYEIIDGEHRWRAAQILGLTEVTIVNLGVVDDSKAKELTILLNELSGKPDEVRLGDLLRDISDSVTPEQLGQIMPFAASELDVLMGAMSFNFSELSGADTRPPEIKAERDAAPMKSSKKVVSVRWGGLSAYDVEKAIAASRDAGKHTSDEDAILAALRYYAANFNSKPQQESK